MLTKLEDDSRAVPPWLCFHGSNGIDGALESFRAQARIGDIYSHTRTVSNITAQQTALAKSKRPCIDPVKSCTGPKLEERT